MDHLKGLELARFVIDESPRPVSVYVVDDHGELIAAVSAGGAAPDTRLNAEPEHWCRGGACRAGLQTCALSRKALH